MKKILSAFFFLLILSGFAFSQTNSVNLKDGSGTVISQHNSIQAAYTVIPTTVTQAYTIEILAAYDQSNETLPITFNLRTGTSPANTITLRPAAGNTGEIITGSSSTGVLIIDDADYVIIDGRPGGTGTTPDLKFQNTATTGSNANTIHFINGATNCIVRYVHALNATQNTAGPRTISFLTSASNPTGNSNNKVTYCKIEGGRSGIGVAGSTPNINDSITISNCEIFDWGYAGIWLVSGAGSVNIDSCKIYQTVGVNNSIVSGVIMSTTANYTYNLRKNWIYNLQSTSTSTSTAMRGIYLSSGAAGTTFNVENNMVSITLDNGPALTHYGIDFAGSNAYTANIYYNTTRIGGTHTGGAGALNTAGIRIAATALTLNMKNNICVNTRAGGSSIHAGFALTNTGGTLNIDYNCYNADTAAGFRAYWVSTGYNNLADYKTAATPNEQNTIFRNINFVSLTNLHLTGTSIGDLNLKGTPIAGITRDFDNDLRNVLAPYRGADEGATPLFTGNNVNSEINYGLSQNYPNPFNPTTTINYDIKKTGFVSLKVYDLLGREVQTLVSEVKTAGSYTVNFNGSEFSSGIYFYKIQAGEFVDTKRMLMLK